MCTLCLCAASLPLLTSLATCKCYCSCRRCLLIELRPSQKGMLGCPAIHRAKGLTVRELHAEFGRRASSSLLSARPVFGDVAQSLWSLPPPPQSQAQAQGTSSAPPWGPLHDVHPLAELFRHPLQSPRASSGDCVQQAPQPAADQPPGDYCMTRISPKTTLACWGASCFWRGISYLYFTAGRS